MFGPESRVVGVVGAQWGDEGKGKLVDVLAERADWVVRYQGGANAGHTVDLGDRSFVLHQIPSGILHPGVRCAIGNGVVLDPDTLFDEIDGLVKAGVDVEGRLYVSERAHLVLPYHKAVDGASASSKAIGTTGRGIGPAYEDKIGRRGVRVVDLRHPERLREIVEKGAAHARGMLSRDGSDKVVDCDAVLALLGRLSERLLPLADDVGLTVHRAVRSGAAVLLEGAQGSLLDIDHGTYPYVTSSNTTAGRPRRCGWFDGIVVKYATRVNGLSDLAVTKLDVLDTLDRLGVCVGYEIDGELHDEFPGDLVKLECVKPKYEWFDGWKRSTATARTLAELPSEARRYLDRIEALVEAPITYVS